MANVIDEASVRLDAESGGLAAEIRREVEQALTAATAGLSSTVQIKVDLDQAAAARLREQLRRIETQQINPMLLRIRTKVTQLTTFLLQRINQIFNRLKLRLTQARVQVDQLLAKLRQIPNRLDIDIELDTTAATARLDAWIAEQRDKTVPLGLDLDTAKATTDLQQWLAAQVGKRLSVGIDVDTGEATTRLDAWIAEQARKTITIPVELNVARAILQLNALRNRVRQAVKITVDVDSAVANAKLDDLIGKVTFLSGRVHNIKVKVDVDGATQLRALVRLLGDANRNTSLFGRNSRGLRGILGGLFSVMRGGAGIISGVVKGLQGLAGAGETALAGLKQFGGGLAQMAVAAATFGLQVALLGAKITAFMAIAGAVTFAVGALGAALLALPAALVGIGAAVGVAALAFDGFGAAIADANTPEELKKQQEALAKLHPEARKVAEVFNRDLKPAFDGFKKEIQGEFFKGLDVPFKQLVQTINGALKPGLLGVTQSMNAFVKQLLGIVTGEEGVRRVNNALSAAKGFLDALLPAVGNLLRAFLDLAGVPEIAQAIGGAFADVLGHVTRFFDEMRRTGEAQAAVTALRGVLSKLTGVFVDILSSATRFFTQAAPGFNDLVGSVGDLATSLIDDLGGAFNTALQAASDFIDNIPEEDLNLFKDAIKDVARALQDFASSEAPGQIVKVITQMIDAFRLLVDVFTTLSNVGNAIDGFFNNLMVSMGTATEETKRMADDYNKSVGSDMPKATEDFANQSTSALERGAQGAKAAAEGMVNGIKQPISTLPGLAQSTFSQLPPIVQDQLSRASQAGITEAGKMAPGIQGPMSEVPGVTQAEFAKLGPEIKRELLAATDAAKAEAAKMPPAVGDAFKQVPEQARAGFEPTAPAVTDEMKKAEDAGKTGSANVVAGVDFAPVEQKAREVFGRVPEAVRTGIDQAVQAVTDGGARLVGAAEREFGKLGPAVERSIGRSLSEAVRRACDDAEREMRDGALRITTAAKFEGVATSAEQAMARIPATVQVNLQTSVTHANTYGGQLTQSWGRTMEEMVRLTDDGMRRMLETITRNGTDAVRTAADVARGIEDAFRQLPEILYTAGMNMMIRLAQGIQTGGQQAIQAAQQVAQAIQGLFPMSPPKWGPLSGEGDPQKSGGRISSRLAAGLTAEADAVEAAAATLAARVAGSLDGASPAARASAVAGASMSTPAARASAPAAASSAPAAAGSGMSTDEWAVIAGMIGQAVHDGLNGSEIGIRDDGRGGRGRLAARQERQFDRRVGSRGAR